MSSLLGGSQSSETTIAPYLEDQSKYVLDRGNAASQIGYTPYYGPDVAALSPLQEAAMQNTSQAANAFGMVTPQSDPLAQVTGTTAPIDPTQYQNQGAATAINDAYRNQLGRDPDAEGFNFWMDNYNPETFGNDFSSGVRVDPLTGLSMPGTTNGVRGYSSAPTFENAINELKERRPGQYEGIMSQFMNPQTGAPSQYQQGLNQQAQQMAGAQGLSQAFMPDFAGNADPSGQYGGNGQGFAGFGDFGFGGLGIGGAVGDAFGDAVGFFGGPSERW